MGRGKSFSATIVEISGYLYENDKSQPTTPIHKNESRLIASVI